jgi:hypothetical protein
MLSVPSGLRLHWGDRASVRTVAAKALVVGGVISYNWWVVVPFVPGFMPSVNGFFSDLEVAGRPHAALMSDADMLAGVLLTAALLVRGARAQGGPRREWKWMVVFAIAGGIGGRFPYACSEGLSAACRQMEWNLQLPLHHYIHVVAGIAEFATLTTAAVIAMRRTQKSGAPVARMYAWVVKVLAVAYPLLGVAYITDRLGTFIEPVFFVAFSVMVAVEVFESQGQGQGQDAAAPTRAAQVSIRGSTA